MFSNRTKERRREEALQEIEAVNQALRDGHAPPGTSTGASAVRVAADLLGVDRNTMRDHCGIPDKPGLWHDWFGLSPDWTLYVAEEPEPEPVEVDETIASPVVPEVPSDPIQVRRLKDEVTRLKHALSSAERRAGDAEDVRAGVLGLLGEPLRPRLVVPSSKDPGKGGRTIILHLSDIHYGETISSEEMDGVNRYDMAIAKSRLGRFFDKAAALATDHWTGTPPEEIIVCLGGDLISGDIHPELAQTNGAAVPVTVREIGEHIAGGIVALRQRVKRPVRVYSVPGNHGRMTLKPQSKGRAAGSLDLLATDFVEATLRGTGINQVEFYRSHSPDAYFSVYGWHFMLTHGDTMGGRGGGTGFIGPMAAIIKGHRKLVDTSWRSGRPVHFVLTAHYHTTGKTAFGWANGSVCGYGEYARDLRADPEPARQNMLVVHPRHGIINEQPLYLGAPSEGSHYAGPATVIRPQWSDDEAA